MWSQANTLLFAKLPLPMKPFNLKRSNQAGSSFYCFAVPVYSTNSGLKVNFLHLTAMISVGLRSRLQTLHVALVLTKHLGRRASDREGNKAQRAWMLLEHLLCQNDHNN